MEIQTQKLIVFLDAVGRTLLGKVADSNKETITIENPALVHIQPNVQTNQLQLQILPLFFKEFQSDKSEPTRWVFNKTSVTLADNINLASQFIAQYEQLFPNGTEKKTEVVKLFDEETK